MGRPGAPEYDREALRARFRNVTVLAGYKNEAPDRIVAEHFDKMMEDIPGFIKMLEEYEAAYAADPDGDPID